MWELWDGNNGGGRYIVDFVRREGGGLNLWRCRYINRKRIKFFLVSAMGGFSFFFFVCGDS